MLFANLLNITMSLLRNSFKILKNLLGEDESFLHWLERLEGVVSKILSLAMIIVIIKALVNLAIYIATDLFFYQTDITKTLFKTFGLFLNVLIALEILENITAYLKKHVVQVELVIVTSLIAVARKIIILDLGKVSGIEIIGLAIAVFSLSISYLIIRTINAKIKD